jgi:hypothetical protein
MLILLFSVVFIGVGASSLAYAQSFAAELEDYCIQKCAESNLLQIEPPVGCECKPEPGHTQLPTAVFFVSPLSSVACLHPMRPQAFTLLLLHAPLKSA